MENNLYNQIESYYLSQNILKKLIKYNIQAEIDLYIINGEWLRQWKKYSCYDEIKHNLPLKNPTKWREIRIKNNANIYEVGSINNKTLFQNINNIITINPYANFNFVTKECFDAFCTPPERNGEKISFKFISYNNKLIYQNKDQIYVIFNNEIYLNFILIDLNNQNNNNLYFTLLHKNLPDFMKQIGLVEAMKEINDSYIKIIFNKSYENIINKKKKFTDLISSLINFDYNFQILDSNEIHKKVYYLINEDWLENFKNKLNYIALLNQSNINDLSPTIKSMFNNFINNISENDNIEIINQGSKIVNYLKDNTNNKIIKFYDNYSFINEDVWSNLIKIFNWNIEIKTFAYINKNYILIYYDEHNFEIIKINDNEISWKLLFCFYKNYKNNEIINEIQNLGINEYLKKYNINIINNNQTKQKLFYNNNQCIGIIINIKAAKINIYDFTLLDNAQWNKKNLILGLNDNNNICFIDYENINNYLNNKIDDYINKIKKNINPFETDIIKQYINKDPNIINYVIQCLKNCQDLSKCILHHNSYKLFTNNIQKYPISLLTANIMKIDFQNNYNLYNAEIQKFKDYIENKYYIDLEDPKKVYEFILDNIHKENKKYFNQNNVQIPNFNDDRKKIFDFYFWNIYKPENTSRISEIFYGVREVLIKCGKCNKPNYEYYIFKYIEFQIEEIIQIAMNNPPNLIQQNRDGSFLKLLQNKITLEKCFEYYLNYFKKNQSIYYCKICSSKNDNYDYNNKIIILPNVLCIVIKRNEGTIFNVHIPESLDISKYLESFVEKKKYELIAVISYDISNNKNNLFSKRKYKLNKNWYNHLDNNIQGLPYMIFYQKKN